MSALVRAASQRRRPLCVRRIRESVHPEAINTLDAPWIGQHWATSRELSYRQRCFLSVFCSSPTP
jgi:hypothetical protein